MGASVSEIYNDDIWVMKLHKLSFSFHFRIFEMNKLFIYFIFSLHYQFISPYHHLRKVFQFELLFLLLSEHPLTILKLSIIIEFCLLSFLYPLWSNSIFFNFINYSFLSQFLSLLSLGFYAQWFSLSFYNLE